LLSISGHVTGLAGNHVINGCTNRLLGGLMSLIDGLVRVLFARTIILYFKIF